MTIHIIEKNLRADERKPKIVNTLSKSDEDSFINYFIDRDSLYSYDKKVIIRLAADIHAQDQWLMCGCSKEQKPMFRLNKSSKGKLFISHLTKRGEHDNDCSLKSAAEYSASRNKEYVPYVKKEGPLNLMSPFANGITKPKVNSNDNKNKISVASRQTKLASTLFKLLDDAGVNRVIQNNKQYPINKLRNEIQKQEIVKGLPLKDYFFFFNSINSYLAPLMKLKNDQAVWPGKIPKNALMLVNITKIDDEVLFCTNKSDKEIAIKIEGKIKVSSGRFGERTGPYMGLIQYNPIPTKPNEYLPRKAFVIPCHKKNIFIPVDSYYERETLKALFSLQLKLASEDIYFEIEKPLFDKSVEIDGVNHSALPDFIVTYQGRKLIIEVNGSEEESYLERKVRTHTIMSHMGTLISFNAIEADKNAATLKAGITNLMNQVESFLC